jgi:hypothetical protein
LLHLVLAYGGYGAWVLPEKADCAFRLHSFRSDLRGDDYLFRFLEFQTELKNFHYGNKRRGWPKALPANIRDAHNFLPNLECISASWEVVLAITPGRPIHTIRTVYDHPSSEGRDLPICCNLGKSRALRGIVTLEVNLPVFQQIHARLYEMCPELQNLSVKFALDPEIPGVR